MTNMFKTGRSTGATIPGGGASYAPNPGTLTPDPAAPGVTWYLNQGGATPGPGYGDNYYSMYVFASPTPPANPFVGQLWWDSINIGLFIWYDDGTSQQWVSAVAGLGVADIATDAPSDGYTYGRKNAIWAQAAPADANIYLMSYLTGTRPDGLDCAAAMASCIAAAATNAAAGRASNIVLPAGKIDLTNATASAGAAGGNYAYLVPDRTRIVGQGMNRTTLTWNQTQTSYNLFGSANYGSPTRGSAIEFADFGVNGNWLDGTSTGSQNPWAIYNVDNLRLLRVGSYFSTAFGFVLRGCAHVHVEGCECAYIVADGISFAGCTDITITGCRLRYLGDDAIAGHSNTGDADTVRNNIVITDNNIFNGVGVAIGSARGVVISGNVFDLCPFHAIQIWTDHVGTEGLSWQNGVAIVANTIRNCWDEGQVTGHVRFGCNAIIIQEGAARAGGAGAIPGENVPGGVGRVVLPQAYFRSNSVTAGVAVPGTWNVLVADNVIEDTLPACDGTVTATGGTGETYTGFTSYGLGIDDGVAAGRLWMRTATTPGYGTANFINPNLPEATFRGTGIAIGGGPLHDIDIVGNSISRLAVGVNVVASWFSGLRIRGNRIADVIGAGAAAGIMINPGTTTGPCTIAIEDNAIDADPFQLSPLRAGNGSWSVNPFHAGIQLQSGGAALGVIVRGNRVRNAGNAILNNSGGAFIQQWDNWAEYQPVLAGQAYPNNRGLYVIGSGSGWRTRLVDSDPASATYGQVLGVPAVMGTAAPATGFYDRGSFVSNTTPSVDGNGNLVLGWACTAQNTSSAAAAFSPVVVPTVGALPLSGGTLTGPLITAALTANGAAAFGGGTNWGSWVATGPTDFSKHINLFGSAFGFTVSSGRLNYIAGAGASHVLNVAGTDIVTVAAAGMTMTNAPVIAAPANGVAFGASGPNIRSGAGAASGTQPSGSIWMRTDGTAGNRMYVSQGGGTWVPIAGV